MHEAILYDASLIGTSVAFGCGVCHHGLAYHPLFLYAATASVLFRSYRLLAGKAGESMPFHPLHVHDLVVACATLVVALRVLPHVRVRLVAASLLMLLAHALPPESRRSRTLHAAGHACVVAAAWRAP